MTPEQALACIEQERLDVMAEGMSEADCNMIAAYVLASAYRKLANAQTEVATYSLLGLPAKAYGARFTITGLTVYEDPALPEGTIEFRDDFGKVLGKIVNVGPCAVSPPARNHCHLCTDPQKCEMDKVCAYTPCRSPFPSRPE